MMTDSDDHQLHVVLYYKYVDLKECRSAIAEWMEDMCRRLSLTGRVRVADDGINGVVCSDKIFLVEY